MALLLPFYTHESDSKIINL